MALTPLRWMALAVGGALLVASIILEFDSEHRWSEGGRWPRVNSLQRVKSAAGNTADRLVMLRVRDSVLGVLARLPRTDTSRVLMSGGLGKAQHSFLLLANNTRRHRPARPAMPVDVAFVLDTARFVIGIDRGLNRWIRVDYLLPATASSRCLVIARVRPRELTYLRQREFTQRLLGPCAFYERFGMPGAQVDAWLLAGGWAFARHNSWFGGPSPWNGPSWVFEVNRGDVFWGARRWMPPEGFRCVAGEPDTCDRIVLTPAARSSRVEVTAVAGTRLVSVNSLHEWVGWGPRPLGLWESRLLGDMVRELGPERFQRFWSSSAAVPDAFRAATERDLGSWVSQWGQSAYGEQTRGPEVPRGGVPLGLGVVALSLAGAGVAARRRQVR